MDLGLKRHYDRYHEAQYECKVRILYLGGHVLCSLPQICTLEVTVRHMHASQLCFVCVTDTHHRSWAT